LPGREVWQPITTNSHPQSHSSCTNKASFHSRWSRISRPLHHRHLSRSSPHCGIDSPLDRHRLHNLFVLWQPKQRCVRGTSHIHVSPQHPQPYRALWAEDLGPGVTLSAGPRESSFALLGDRVLLLYHNRAPGWESLLAPLEFYHLRPSFRSISSVLKE
jgi:hypothetical protein